MDPAGMKERLIVEVAQALFHERGYADVSMDELARRLGMGKATLYKHFASKEEVLAACIAHSMEQNLRYLDELPPSMGPLLRIQAWLRHGLRRRLSMMPDTRSAPTQQLHHHPLLTSIQARMFEAHARLVREAQAAGEIRPELPVAFVVASTHQLFGPQVDHVAEQTGLGVEAVVDLMIDVFLRGVAAAPR